MAGTTEQVRAWGTPAAHGPWKEVTFPPHMSAPSPATRCSRRRAGQGGPSSRAVGKSHHRLFGGSQVRPSRGRSCQGNGGVCALAPLSALPSFVLLSARHRQLLSVCQADCVHGAFLNDFKHPSQAHTRTSTPYSQLLLYRPRWAAQGLSAAV